jgi:signal transduction histidine kinase
VADVAAFGPTAAVRAITTAPGQALEACRRGLASRASVSVARANGSVRIEVTDDGVGGARVGTGSGLTGLADRIAALEGSLEVKSPSGGGTTVRAEIPCG